MNLIFLALLFFSSPLFSAEENPPPIVLVSLASYKYFVEEIAKTRVQVQLMVPPGASAHTYEPTPKQMISAGKADLWFFMGEPFEKKAIDAFKSAYPAMEFIDLRKGISLMQGTCKHDHGAGSCGEDLHVWLSPKLAKIQAKTIGEGLIARYPAYAAEFTANMKSLFEELDLLDGWIEKTLAKVKNRTLLVSHPAYGYFCKEYNFTQLPIEFEGKDPTAKQLTALLLQAKDSKVRFIFTQPQYSTKAATLISKEIGAELLSVDPYSEDYSINLRHIATLIHDHS